MTKRVQLAVLFSAALLLSGAVGGKSMTGGHARATGLFPFVSTLNQKIGYMDAQGNAVIAPRFEISCTREVYKVVSDKELNCLITSMSKAAFSEGLAAVKVNRLYGYVNESGELKISPQYDDAGTFSGGLAWVRKALGYGYIDASGQTVIAPTFEGASDFSEGLARVMVKGQYGYINRAAKFIIDPQFAEAGDFSCGLAWVKVKDKYGFINAARDTVIPPLYDEAGNFSEGLARVRVRGKYGYVDEKGEFVIKPTYPYAEDFSDGLAVVSYDSKTYYYINRAERKVLTITEGRPYSFKDGVALVDLGSQVLESRAIKADTPNEGLGPRARSSSGHGCYPFFRDKLLLKFAYINKKGERIYQGAAIVYHACEPEAGPSSNEFYTEAGLVDVTIDSAPSSATLYLVPTWDWNHTPDIMADDNKLRRAKKYEGHTRYQESVVADDYVIVIEYNGKKYTQEKDFERLTNKYICVPLTAACPQ